MRSLKFSPVFILGFILISSAFAEEIEIPRYLEVSEGIYRSGRPNEEAMNWLKDEQKIKTIINLENDFYYVDREERWAKERNIHFYSLPMDGQETPKEYRVNKALDLLNDPTKHPILVHCKYGRDRTGLVIGLHRVENEDEDKKVAYQEMKDLGFRVFLYKLDRYYKKRTNYFDRFLALLDN